MNKFNPDQINYIKLSLINMATIKFTLMLC